MSNPSKMFFCASVSTQQQVGWSTSVEYNIVFSSAFCLGHIVAQVKTNIINTTISRTPLKTYQHNITIKTQKYQQKYNSNQAVIHEK